MLVVLVGIGSGSTYRLPNLLLRFPRRSQSGSAVAHDILLIIFGRIINIININLILLIISISALSGTALIILDSLMQFSVVAKVLLLRGSILSDDRMIIRILLRSVLINLRKIVVIRLVFRKAISSIALA